MLYEQFPVESVRVVEVYGVTFLVSHVRGVIVVRVERHHGHMMRRQGLNYLLHHGGLAGARTPGYAYNSSLIHNK